MKVSITLSDPSVNELQRIFDAIRGTGVVVVQADLPPKPTPAKRKRRTKEEMEADRIAEQDAAQEAAATISGDPPISRRRKKRGADTGPEVADANL